MKFVAAFGFFLSALVQTVNLLSELSEDEGKDLVAPYEFRVATFAATEGSYGSGPRVLLIWNDRSRAVVSVHGKRTELTLVSTRGDTQCKAGGRREERFEAPGLILTTTLRTSPGQEACWLEGSITVLAGTERQVLRVKGVAGI